MTTASACISSAIRVSSASGSPRTERNSAAIPVSLVRLSINCFSSSAICSNVSFITAAPPGAAPALAGIRLTYTASRRLP